VDRTEAAALIEHLLMHQSADGCGAAAVPCSSYKRLEFLGDAALDLAFSNFHFLTNPDLGLGALSTLQATNISTKKLSGSSSTRQRRTTQ
jgi:dsRNA-specific ribonuclease